MPLKTFRCRALALSAMTLLLSCRAQLSSPSGNFDFEQVDYSHKTPRTWVLSRPGVSDAFVTELDSQVVQHGRYAVRITNIAEPVPGGFGVCQYTIPATFTGSQLKLSGYLKTEDVSGFAGIWMRTDGKGGVLQLNNMRPVGLMGTTDWTKYSVELPYDPVKTTNILVGGLLAGKGKVWVDNLQLEVDGMPYEQAAPKKMTGADLDTSMNSGSGIHHIALTPKRVQQLTNLGMLWGFLKYYHPAIAEGKHNWDAALLRLLPAILATAEDNIVYAVMEKWVDVLGPVIPCKHCADIDSSKIRVKPDYGYLFQPHNLPASLVQKLASIRDNYKQPPAHYYVSMASGVGNPQFGNEQTFGKNPYPDAGIRLVALYQYWNIIQYFYPNRHITGEDWNQVLATSIQPFVEAADKYDYTRAFLRIIARVNDTHANIWGNNPTLDTLIGTRMVPVIARFAENKLVVTGHYKDTMEITRLLQPGDVIDAINHQPVQKLVKQYLPVTPASNLDAQLRDLPGMQGWLLRTNDTVMQLTLVRDGRQIKVPVATLPLRYMNRQEEQIGGPAAVGYKLLDGGNIGYIYPARLTNNDLATIKRLFAKTKAIIFDFRCYPAVFMPYTYGEWLKPAASPFVKFDFVGHTQPGLIEIGGNSSNGISNDSSYKGKVVMLVDSRAQSQSEYTVMAFQTTPDNITIGSTTSGADGDISTINLPGNVKTFISGIGIYYPDGRQTQRVGIKIDMPVRPTIRGIKEGRDELMEAALKVINGH
ncbi:hypothetical protein KTO58_03175 [Chitinophaga pendula]|uniref:S41 family peptidase n=1 Tax=Chitinophaga TaxID=79328 RepID=UPI000BB0055C|nr:MULTISPECIES: S41 family peptidase [Chitinophaga]ASZ14164.1 hypothetical protein CK934_26045 [Chitinophaga sp. MD30]UCJ08201.1 hypothetical protein KTO58_03175 [Chitinophaga pendula]